MQARGQGDLNLGAWGRKFDLSIAELEPPGRRPTTPVYSTSFGTMYCGLSEKLLPDPKLRREHGKAQLIFTSPPFPLSTRKDMVILVDESISVGFRDSLVYFVTA